MFGGGGGKVDCLSRENLRPKVRCFGLGFGEKFKN